MYAKCCVISVCLAIMLQARLRSLEAAASTAEDRHSHQLRALQQQYEAARLRLEGQAVEAEVGRLLRLRVAG